jgi:hypothetical protein
LQIIAIVVVIGSATAFMTGMNMVAAAASEKSSSHPKGPREQRSPASKPSEKVDLPLDAAIFPEDLRRSG